MSVIFFLIPLSILAAAGFLVAFIWAVRAGQYEDTTTPPMRLLMEDRGRMGPDRAESATAKQVRAQASRSDDGVSGPAVSADGV